MIKDNKDKNDIDKQIQGMMMYFNGGGYAVLDKLNLKFGYELINSKQTVVSPIKLDNHGLYQVKINGNNLKVKPISNSQLIEVMNGLLKLGKKAKWLDNSKLNNKEVQELKKLINSFQSL